MVNVLRLMLLLALSGCGGLAWNTTVADDAGVRDVMVASVVVGHTTEGALVRRWGNPTQKFREGGQTTFVYRNMSNPPGYLLPRHGVSDRYVMVVFQYGVAVAAWSSDTEGCRATFPPMPPGPGFDNPATVHPVNCGAAGQGAPGAPDLPPMVPSDEYDAGGKYDREGGPGRI